MDGPDRAVLVSRPSPCWEALTPCSKEGSAINNNFLSQQGDTLGLYTAARTDAGQAARLFPTPYEKTYSLHVKNEAHQVCLLGSNGVLQLVDRVNPTGADVPSGQIMEWSTFVIDGQGRLNVNDGVDHPLRHWIAWEKSDGAYAVGLYDGESLMVKSGSADWIGVTLPTPANYENVTVIAANAPK
jgi:hypothetical protein